MATILGTWNPDNWSWTDYQRAVKQTAAGRPYSTEWSVDRRRYGIEVGDRFFLLQQVREPRGVVASGTVLSLPVVKDHWNGKKGATTNYVAVRFDTVLNSDHVLAIARLVAELPNTHWTPQGSGTTVNAADEKNLERIWAEHIR